MVLPPAVNSQPNSTPFSGFTFPSNSIDSGKAFRHPQPEFEPFGSSSSGMFGEAHRHFSGSPFSFDSSNGTSGQVKQSPFGKPNTEFFGQAPGTSNLWGAFGSSTAALGSTDASPSSCRACAIVRSYKQQGSCIYCYTPIEDTRENDFAVSPKLLTSISAMNAYCNKSHEELRLEDYEKGNKGKISTSPFQPASSPAPCSPFGSPSSEPPRSPFQTASSQAPCSLFGSPSSEPPRSPFHTTSSQAPCSLFGSPSSEPPRSPFHTTSSQAPCSLFGSPSSEPPRSPFQPASSQAPCSLFGSPSSEPPRSPFQPASSQAPCSLFGSPSSEPPRSPFQPASSQAPCSLFGSPSSEPPRSPFQPASSQAPCSLFGSLSSEPPRSPFQPASSQALCSLFGSPSSEPPRSPFQPASSQAPCSLFGSPSSEPPRSPFQPASSQAPCSLFGSPSSEPPRSPFQPASSQAPCSLFGSSSSVPPRSPFQSASSQAPCSPFGSPFREPPRSPCSLFGSPSTEPPRSPFQSASSQASGGSLFGPPSSEPPRSPFKFGFGKTTSTSQHAFQSTGISSSIPEAASDGVRCCNCKCNQPNALARINPTTFSIVHANTSLETQGTNTFISYPAFVTFIHPAATANGAHSTAFTSIASPGNQSTSSFTFGPNVVCSTPPSTLTNTTTASCLPSLSTCPSLQSPAPSFSHNTLAANQGATCEPTVFGKACSNKLKLKEANDSPRVPKGLEIIVEKLGFNPWSKGKGIADEQHSESKDILPCEEAYKDDDIIALAEFAVEQQNALQEVKKFKFLSVVAACLEAVGGGRYHIVLEARNTRVSFMSTPERFYAVVSRKGTERTNQLTLLEKWLGVALYFATSGATSF